MSEFYLACRNGDVRTVEALLTKLTATEINRAEATGSTALHAAAFYGQTTIVRLLLEHGADASITDKEGKTPKQTARTKEIEALFQNAQNSSSRRAIFNKRQDVDDADDDLPQCEEFQIYSNANNTENSILATQILKTRLATYPVNQRTIRVPGNMDYLEKQYRIVCEDAKNSNAWELGKNIFQQYQQTKNFTYILKLYTLNTIFTSMVQDDHCFHIEMYRYLLSSDTNRACGRFFRAVWLSSKHVKFFQWSLAHQQSLLELQTPMITMSDRNIVLEFLKALGGTSNENQKVLFEFKFADDSSCFTAIESAVDKKSGLREAWLLPGTLFSVNNIGKTHDNTVVVTLTNVPVEKRVLLTTSNALAR